MAKDQRNVEAITPMEVDFAKWYTDICLKAELVDYASGKQKNLADFRKILVNQELQCYYDKKHISHIVQGISAI